MRRWKRCPPTPVSSSTIAGAVASVSSPGRATAAFFARTARCRARRSSPATAAPSIANPASHLTASNISIYPDIWNLHPPSWCWQRWRSRRGSTSSGCWSSVSRRGLRQARSPGRSPSRKTPCRRTSPCCRGQGLVTARRTGRSIVYRADLVRLQAVMSFLVNDCCDGRPEICAPLIESITTCCPPKRKRKAHARSHV